MQQMSCLKLIYKIHSSQLRKSNWDLHLPLETAMSNCPECVVSLSDSQLLRFINEINGITDLDEKVSHLQHKIKIEKRKPRNAETRAVIKNMYNTLYSLQFQKDYVCVIMDSNKDYDLTNKGFKINGIEYRRFLGTNGGIKKSTIVYVNKELYPELKKRLDNGRNKDIPLVPAKLEAYQALICSGSTVLPKPKGIIVVNDCITNFKDDVFTLNDECDGEPILEFVKDYEVEHNNSDGFGLMTPEYSKRVNEFINGDGEHTIAGFNSRYSFEKGMVYTFDFVEFAEKVAGTYLIKDVWGDVRDVRNADVILTESMLKLFNCYDSWEDYFVNCEENHYEFSAPKVTPDKLENVRFTNYQFLQSYQLADDELRELCQPTVDQLKDVLCDDYRKSLAFLIGKGANEKNINLENFEYFIQALMIDERMLCDPYVRRKISNLITKRIDMAKRGAIQINANFAMISGDPYALCQSMFGLEVTGLLSAGEIYHKYWIDKGVDELACFRAPMTCHNNIRKLKLNKSDEAAYWFRYMDTVSILNAFDTTCDAMNGCDFDGDTMMCTDNRVLIENTLNSPTIFCIQRKAEKKIATEDDIIQSNKLAFNDDIGIVTNYVTSMFEVQAEYEQDSKEYKELSYRIMCGQLYQQNCIDRAKGIISKPMPEYWYNKRLTKKLLEEEKTEENIFNNDIVAYRKPYFMTYVYPDLKKKNREYNLKCKYGSILKWSDKDVMCVDDLYNHKHKSREMKECLSTHDSKVGYNRCIVNRISEIFEDEFFGVNTIHFSKKDFDYSILKSDVEYSKNTYKKILEVYKEYKSRIRKFKSDIEIERYDDYEIAYQRKLFIENFKSKCEIICSNEKELCDILIDICYSRESTKQFAWDVCGDVIIRNLLERNNHSIHIPTLSECDYEFVYCGDGYSMREVNVEVSE